MAPCRLTISILCRRNEDTKRSRQITPSAGDLNFVYFVYDKGYYHIRTGRELLKIDPLAAMKHLFRIAALSRGCRP